MNIEYFFFSEEELGEFSYETYKFGGLRFFLELAIFLAKKLGLENPEIGISFFRMVRGFLEGVEGLKGYDGYNYSAAAMIHFLLFLRLCRIATRANGLEFLRKHEEWAIALGFSTGIPDRAYPGDA